MYKQAAGTAEILKKLSEIASKAKGGIMDGVEALKGFGNSQLEAAKNIPELFKKVTGPGETSFLDSVRGTFGQTGLNEVDKTSLKQLLAALGITSTGAGAAIGFGAEKMASVNVFDQLFVEGMMNAPIEKVAAVTQYLYQD